MVTETSAAQAQREMVRRGRPPAIERTEQETAALNKEKEDRFVAAASRRTTNALRTINQLRNCLNPQSYKYTEADWTKILETLSVSIEDLSREAERRLAGGREAKEKITFNLR